MKRILGAPLWCHAAGLLLVLLALLPFARTDTVFFADEGSALAQARQLADGDGWTRPLSFPEADPGNKSFPLLNGTVVGDRLSPLGYHPTYSLALEPWYTVTGRTGGALLSITGLVVAAYLAGRLTRRLRPGLEVAAFWAVGAASPLFFDGYLTVAHTLAAAAAAAAALAIVRFLNREQRPVMLTVAGASLIAAGLLRNEAVLFTGAIGIVLLVEGLRWRDRPVLGLGVVLGVAGVATRAGEAAIRSQVLGTSVSQFSVASEGNWISHHADGAFTTLLLTSYGNFDLGDICLMLGVTCAFAAAVIARRRPDDRSGLLLFGGLAVALLAARLALTPTPVPGILWACPLLGVATVLISKAVIAGRPIRILLGATAVFALALLATQYSGGGGREWGWRYFSLALPIIIPIALIAIVDGAARLSSSDRRVAGRLLVGLCVLVSISAFLALRDTRSDNRAIVDGIRAAYEATPAADGGKPVVVTTQWGTIDRFNWDRVDQTRWLVIAPTDRSQVAVYLDRIAMLGVGEVTFVTTDIDEDLPFVTAHGDVVADVSLPNDHRVLTVRLRRP
jgi:hypothetical protein